MKETTRGTRAKNRTHMLCMCFALAFAGLGCDKFFDIGGCSSNAVRAKGFQVHKALLLLSGIQNKSSSLPILRGLFTLV